MKDKLMESLASLSDKDIKGLDTRSESISPITAITSFQSGLEKRAFFFQIFVIFEKSKF